MLLWGLMACSQAQPDEVWFASPVLTPVPGVTDFLLQAVSPVSSEVVWVSGHGGTWARTLDGGETWTAGVVPGQDSLQFRDLKATHTDTAVLLAAGTGERSALFRTTDGGATWTEVFRNRNPQAFFSCFDLWEPAATGGSRRGLAFSDQVEGRFPVMVTTDGGVTWAPLPEEGIPPAHDGEGGFASSGTCLVTVGARHGWMGTGAADSARVLRTNDAGGTWHTATSPIAGGDFAGITSLAFRDTLTGWAFGGDLSDLASRVPNVAATGDGGASWTLLTPSHMPGPIYGSAVVPGTDPTVLVTVGPGGADLSLDGGHSWAALDSVAYWAVGFASPSAGWLVGPQGRLTRVDLRLERR
ncbi:MAG: hypothetical protein WEA09_05730 [Gemmatimonadota bacterium]